VDRALGIKVFADKAFYAIGGTEPKKPEVVPFLLKKDAEAHAAKIGGKLANYTDALSNIALVAK
jgi:NitT/TauT family transport system substrate-binding protein